MGVPFAKYCYSIVAICKLFRRGAESILNIFVCLSVAQPQPNVASKQEIKWIAFHISNEIDDPREHDRSRNWRIEGNQLIQGGSSGTIILLNDDYFIYAGDHDAVFFHTRTKE